MTMKKAPTKPSAGLVAAEDVTALLRARNPLLWVTTREETRVERYLVEAAAAAGYKRTFFWDVAAGVTNVFGEAVKASGIEGAKLTDCGETLTKVREIAEKGEKDTRTVWIMRDLPIWIDNGAMGATPMRQLRNLSKLLPGVPKHSAQAIIILTTSGKIPADLSGHATVVDWPLPDRSEIEKELVSALNSLPEFKTDKGTGEPDTTKPVRANAVTPESRELAIDAAVGLTAEEAASCYAKSLVQTNTIDAALVMTEKKRVITKSGLGLEWHDPIPGGLDAVGGLDNLKKWLSVRKTAYSPAAREYGLPAPKGAVLVGLTGCGKTLTAKCAATAWGVPLIRLDLGALQAKYVGESQQNIRQVFKIIETIDRCIVWIDEIEKAMAGSSSGASDGGVSADALAVVLNWMQERKSNAFVIATANDVTALPPELLRKGRFDEIFYVGLPNDTERDAVLKAALRANGRGDLDIDYKAVRKVTEGFTGAEIAELVPTSLYVAFEDGAREPTTADLLEAAGEVNPYSKGATGVDQVAKLEKWGRDNARPASAKPKNVRLASSGGRVLDLIED